MNFAPSQAEDASFLEMFVGRDAELAALDASVKSGDGCVILGRRGTGKTALWMAVEPTLRSRHPGGVYQIRGSTVLKQAKVFLAEHYEGFFEKALVILDDTDPLKPSELREILSALSKLKNLQVIATASNNAALPKGYNSIALAPIDHRKVLEARLGHLARRRGKSDQVVENALKAIDIVASKSTSDTSPREAIQAVLDVMRTWESARSTTPEAESASEAPSKSVLFAKIQNYLKTRVDYLGITVAIGLYFLANSSDEKFNEVEERRHNQLMSQIKILVKASNTIKIGYFTSASLNLRESPSRNDPVIAVLQENTQLKVMDTDKMWLYVEDMASRNKGWVYGRYVVPVLQRSFNK